jgi:signal transduction histidine kinase
LITYLTLLGGVLLALAVPLAATIAGRDTKTVLIDRLNDIGRFASLAEPAVRTGQVEALSWDLESYNSLYGIGVAVFDRYRRIVVASPGWLRRDDPEVDAALDAALVGERPGMDRVVWPWRQGPLVVAEPVSRGGDIIGAVVTMSPTDGIRARTLRRWALLATVGLAVLVAGALAAAPLTRWMLRPVRDLDEAAHAIAAGRLTARVAVGAGPTELRRLAESFNQMADTVARLLEQQRAFVSYASHQLRNPLAALRLRVENLVPCPDPALDPATARDHALTIDEVDRLAGICDGLLALAHADAADPVVVTVDVAALAEDRVAAWAPVAARAGVTLTRAGPATALARAGAGVVDQVLDALIDNAIKFAGPDATVTVTVGGDADGAVDLHVIDDGPGLPTNAGAAATEPFWRNPAHQNIAGSGLGLAIASTLLERTGARLDLAPGEPHGLDARLRLPAGTAP